ncbi:MAG TPA: hypothetical protein DFS52_05950, partial [Myxococcales bacterium]|nr:hypothetical protein [Myxococcales bacterium]
MARNFQVFLYSLGLVFLSASCGDSEEPGKGGDAGLVEICDNGKDDDGDMKTDCADPDCRDAPECTAIAEICNNHEDDDGDGKIDCADPD